MKLVYRGVSYEHNPHSQQPTQPREIRPTFTLMYRGAAYTVDPNIDHDALAFKPMANLVYRGVAYALNGGTVEASRKLSSKVTAKELARVHRNNIYRNVQRRLQAAQARGDQQLVALLEQELQQIA